MSEFEVAVTAHEKAELKPLRGDQQAPGGPLGENDVEGHTVVTLVSPGTELAMAFTGSNFPMYPGYAAVFKVERAGAAVSDMECGDLAFAMCPHRSFQRLGRKYVVPVPHSLDPDIAVIARLMGVSMSTLATTTARPPGIVVIAGLGPVGNLAAQIFHSCGYQVLGCDPVEWRCKLLSDTGVKTLPSLPLDDPAYLDRVALVVDCSGHEGAVLDGCKLVRKRGEVVLVGAPWRKRTDLSAHDLHHAIFHRYVVLRSGWEWELPTEPAEFRPGSILENFAGALDWLNKGRIRTAGFADSASPADAQTVYSNLLHQRAHTLTTVFDWRRL